MACEQWHGKLDAYVDGELESVEASTLGIHLRSCAPCAAAALERVQLKRSVQMAGIVIQLVPNCGIGSQRLLPRSRTGVLAGCGFWRCRPSRCWSSRLH